MSQRLLTREEVADRLGIKARWLQRKVQSGEIPHTRFGEKYIRFTEEQVAQIIAIHAQGSGPRRKSKPAAPSNVTALVAKTPRGPNRRRRQA